MTEIIGNGEVTALSILKKEYGKSIEYSIQVPFKDLMSYEFKDGLSERQMKESVDIVLYTLFDTVCIRVQGKDHKGVL